MTEQEANRKGCPILQLGAWFLVASVGLQVDPGQTPPGNCKASLCALWAWDVGPDETGSVHGKVLHTGSCGLIHVRHL